MKAVCYNQNTIELDFTGDTLDTSSISESDIRVFVNGYARTFSLSLQPSIIIVLKQPLKSLDQAFVRVRQRASAYDSGVVKVQLALQVNTSQPSFSNAICATSLNPLVRGWVPTNTIIDAAELSMVVNFSNPEFIRASYNPKGVSISKKVTQSSNPGKVGEVFQFYSIFRSTQPVLLRFEQKDVFRKIYSYSEVFGGDGSWKEVSTSYTLPAVGEVSVYLEVPPSNTFGFADFKHARVSSDWRGVLMDESLSSATSWDIYGDGYSSSDNSLIPSWEGILRKNNFVLLTSNSLTLGAIS